MSDNIQQVIRPSKSVSDLSTKKKQLPRPPPFDAQLASPAPRSTKYIKKFQLNKELPPLPPQSPDFSIHNNHQAYIHQPSCRNSSSSNTSEYQSVPASPYLVSMVS